MCFPGIFIFCYLPFAFVLAVDLVTLPLERLPVLIIDLKDLAIDIHEFALALNSAVNFPLLYFICKRSTPGLKI